MINFKKIAITGAAAGLFLSSAAGVLAHGGGANGVDFDDPNCMGQLARMHANPALSGTDTQKGFGSNQPHPNFGGPDATIQEQAQAFQTYCGIGGNPNEE